jgi:hypothetical protein
MHRHIDLAGWGMFNGREDSAAFFRRRVDVAVAVEVVRQVCIPLILTDYDIICIDFSNKPLPRLEF